MAGISLGGVNLDVNGIVSQLMSLEARPLDKLKEQQTNYNSQLSELGRLKSALSKFQSSMESLSSLDKFETYKASNSETSDQTYSATVDSDAVAGTYSIEVTSIALVNKLGQDPDDASPVVFDSDTAPYSGTDTLDLDDGTNFISVDIQDKTITQVRDAINTAAQATDPETGLSASVIQTGTDTFQLVITASETGTANQVNITNSNDASSALGLVSIQDAADGKVKIDGYEVTSSTNTIEGAIPGVTLNLLQDTNTQAELTVSRDNDAVKSSINEFISSYNSVLSSIKIYETGALKGDSFLNSIKNSIRNEINSSSGTGTFNYLAEIGVTTDAKSGELKLDSDALDKAITSDFEAVSKLFAETDKGVAYRLDDKIDEYISYTGLIKGKEDGINSRLRTNSKEQDSMLSRLALKEAAFLKQFSSLDSLIGEMNSTSNALAGQLASLPGYTR
jgi:flagellar hook-associated protein 2